MTKRNILIIDIDDILHDLNEMLRLEATKHGIHYTRAEIRDWDYTVAKIGLDEFTAVLRAVYNSKEHLIHQGAVDGCHKLCSLGYELHYFTDRPHGYKKITRNWLKRHDFPMSQNLHVCKDKRADIAKLPKDRIAALIDDRPRTMVWALTQMQIPMVFSLRTEYNQNMSDIPNVHLADSWAEMLILIDNELHLPNESERV